MYEMSIGGPLLSVKVCAALQRALVGSVSLPCEMGRDLAGSPTCDRN